MLGNYLGAQINALVADHHRIAARDPAAARYELLALVTVRAAEAALGNVTPIALPARGGKALGFLFAHPRARRFNLGTVTHAPTVNEICGLGISAP